MLEQSTSLSCFPKKQNFVILNTFESYYNLVFWLKNENAQCIQRV